MPQLAACNQNVKVVLHLRLWAFMRISSNKSSSRSALSDFDTQTWALQLNIMLSAGVPLLRALESIAESELPRVAPACCRLVEKLGHGHRLSSALESIRPLFSNFIINLVLVGENTGTLAQVMERASERAARRDKLRRDLKAALAYPTFLALVSLAMAAFMAFYMFPKLLPFLQSQAVPLPWPTRLLVWLSESSSLAFLLLTILGAWFCHLMARGDDPRVTRTRNWIRFNSPGIGKLNNERLLADILQDLCLLLEAGCDLVTALKTVRPASPGQAEQVQRCLRILLAGSGFSEAAEASGLLPRRFAVQVIAAEEVGELARAFRDISDVLDESVNFQLSRFVQFAEPAILIIMGLATGFVVLASFMPLYNLVTATL